MKPTLKTTLKATLQQRAEENVSITKGTKKAQTVIKPGIPLDHAEKQKPAKKADKSPSAQIVGMSKGITKNMDNYESLRIDCWLSDTVQKDESVKEAYERIETVIDEVLESSVLATIAEYK